VANVSRDNSTSGLMGYLVETSVPKIKTKSDQKNGKHTGQKRKEKRAKQSLQMGAHVYFRQNAHGSEPERKVDDNTWREKGASE